MELAIFFVLAVVAVAAGLGVIVQRSPVRSALFLLLNFCCLAGLYILLNAQFVAFVQIIIYAGAVVVLFLFVVMLLGIEGSGRGESPSGTRDSEPGARSPEPESRFTNHTLQWIAAALLGALLLAGVIWALSPGFARGVAPAAVTPGSDVRQIGAALLTAYTIPFELTSLILLIAMIGAVVLAKRRWGG